MKDSKRDAECEPERDPKRDPMIGVAIGRYVIQSRLAVGGMGAVYLAVHERLPVRKVVKVLLAEYSRNEVIRRRFEREATAASRLDHRHIVRIDDFGALPDGQLFLVMPFLDGESLEAHLRHTRPTLHHTCQILVQLCSALQHLHEAGIVHRDLKPGNVFLRRTAENPVEVVLIDLGIARDLSAESAPFSTQSGIAMGTPGYMAVEQFGNAATASPRADVYAAAIIAWEMLTGQLPWGVHDPRALYLKQMTEPPSLPAGCRVPTELGDLLVRTLAVEPALRPASARDFALAFAAAVPAVAPHRPSGPEMLLRFSRDLVEHAPHDRATVRHTAATPPTGSPGAASVQNAAVGLGVTTVAQRRVETTLGAASGATEPTGAGRAARTAAAPGLRARAAAPTIALAAAAVVALGAVAAIRLRAASAPATEPRRTAPSESAASTAAGAPTTTGAGAPTTTGAGAPTTAADAPNTEPRRTAPAAGPTRTATSESAASTAANAPTTNPRRIEQRENAATTPPRRSEPTTNPRRIEPTTSPRSDPRRIEPTTGPRTDPRRVVPPTTGPRTDPRRIEPTTGPRTDPRRVVPPTGPRRPAPAASAPTPAPQTTTTTTTPTTTTPTTPRRAFDPDAVEE